LLHLRLPSGKRAWKSGAAVLMSLFDLGLPFGDQIKS
jgi:hypothetical protein